MTTYQDVLREVRYLTPEEQAQLRKELETLAQSQAAFSPQSQRIAGLHEGRVQIVISDDFNDPLPDEYTGWA